MNEDNDAELLRRYAEHRAEDAFAEIVRRHVNLVYSAALRQVNGDAHLAQEVTQRVFADLAQKAGALARHRVLAGWLFTSTRYAAAKQVRGERRRQARETEAQLMQERFHDDDGVEALDWGRVRPVLDAALAELGEADRVAVLLRFFEGRDYAGVGARLGLGENAARMRVERAVDKLRGLLDRRGVGSTTAALALALGNQAVLAAPAGLAATVTGAALMSAAAGGGGAAVLTFMSMTKLQLGFAGAVIALGVGGVAVQSKSNAALRDELAGLRGRDVGMAVLAADNARLVRAANEVGTLRADDAELARLGEEAARLKAQMGETARVAAAKAKGAGLAPIKGEILPAAKVDVQPKPTFQAQPMYPAAFRGAGVSGEALIKFVVDAQGKVRDAVVVKATHAEFGVSAVDAVGKWQFDPGQKDGRKVNTELQVPIVFTIAAENRGGDAPKPAGAPAKAVSKVKQWF
ncbi:MAG: TonB family protein [Undibacterium sp.]|nr:TonB family protein [Opitutaceae bacterium]